MAKKALYLGILIVGGYVLYRYYKKRNEVVVRSGSIEYVYEKPESDA